MHRFILALLFACLSPPAGATTHVIVQDGITFVPSTVIVVEGDVVRWEQTAASHTVTNGTGSGDPNAGTLFDAPLDPATPVFEYTFNTVGTYPFFCRPHEFFGMQGTVIVDAPTFREPTTWGELKALHTPAGDRED